MGCFRTKKQIPETDYNKLKEASYKEISDYVLNVAYTSSFNPNGYGFFSPKLLKEDDICYASWECCDSCD